MAAAASVTIIDVTMDGIVAAGLLKKVLQPVSRKAVKKAAGAADAGAAVIVIVTAIVIVIVINLNPGN